MERFLVNEYLRKGEKCQLANLLNISQKRVEKWFRNMRHKRKAQGMLPKSEYVH